MKIITKQLAEKLHKTDSLMKNTILNPLNVKRVLQILKKNNKIEIFDATHNPLLKKKILCVKDHLNKTGSNPLVKIDENYETKFIDLQNIYKPDEGSIITTCCGEVLNGQYQYPSHFLCHLTIMARYVGIKQIKAFIINIL